VASIYKDPQTGKYMIAYYPRPRRRKIITGCLDYKATKALADKLENEAWGRRKGLVDSKIEKLSQSEAMPLADHLAAFIVAMKGKDGTEKHVKRTESFIRAILDACGFTKPADLDAAKASAYVADLKRDGKHARAINARLTAIKSFTRWMFRTERLRTDPMMQVSKLNAKADRRHVRRAFGDDELERLIAAARQGGAWTWQKGNGKPGDDYRLLTLSLDGPDRAMLYHVAAETGLRAGELASLTPACFDLADLDSAAVKVQAAYSKHRRDDVVAMRRDFALIVAVFIEGRPADAALFTVPDRTADMLKADLAAARDAWLQESATAEECYERFGTDFLAYRDGSDRMADFHALRHTFITRLARSGVAPAVAKSLARHSTITLTIDHYTHTLIGDERAALNKLPSITPPRPNRETAKATGTYDRPADSQGGIARRVARTAPDRPKLAIIGQHEQESILAQKPNRETQLASPANTRPQWALQDSNLGPRDYESPALTAELRARFCSQAIAGVRKCPCLLRILHLPSGPCQARNLCHG